MPVGQTDFTSAVLDPNLATPNGLIDPQGRPAGKRFDVYRNNVIVSLTDAMEEAFPVINKLVGNEFFRAMSVEYVRHNPPTSPLLMFYGENFPSFLEGFQPVETLPYLPDVARLEQARRSAYHAADSTALDPQILSSLDPEALMASQFVLQSAFHTILSPYPILSIWIANMEENAPAIQPIAESVIVFRPEFDLEMIAISSSMASFVHSLSQGTSLGDAHDATLELDENFDLSEAIGLLLQHGLITALTQRKET
jgi:hypothetical protein